MSENELELQQAKIDQLNSMVCTDRCLIPRGIQTTKASGIAHICLHSRKIYLYKVNDILNTIDTDVQKTVFVPPESRWPIHQGFLIHIADIPVLQVLNIPESIGANFFPGNADSIDEKKDKKRSVSKLLDKEASIDEQDDIDFVRQNGTSVQIVVDLPEWGFGPDHLFIQIGEEPADESPFELQSEGSCYGLEELVLDQDRELISTARLAGDDIVLADGTATTFGFGTGEYYNDSCLGYGLAPGDTVAYAASRAGFGKTAFLLQILFGLAMTSVRVVNRDSNWGTKLTPIILLSEMSPQALAFRALGSMLGVPASWFRAGKTAFEKAKSKEEEGRMKDAWQRGREALDPRNGLLGRARSEFVVRIGEGAFGEEQISLIERYRESLAKKYPFSNVVPIVGIDPIQRFLPQARDDIEALNYFAHKVRTVAQSKGWIVMMTSDTNKFAATGQKHSKDPQEEGAGVFRGSYGLQHEVEFAQFMRKPPKSEKTDIPEVEIVTVKSRWSPILGGTEQNPWPRFDWYGQYLRFVPLELKETRRRVVVEQRDDKKERRKKSDESSEYMSTEDAP